MRGRPVASNGSRPVASVRKKGSFDRERWHRARAVRIRTVRWHRAIFRVPVGAVASCSSRPVASVVKHSSFRPGAFPVVLPR